jgi:hypothetical protein
VRQIPLTNHEWTTDRYSWTMKPQAGGGYVSSEKVEFKSDFIKGRERETNKEKRAQRKKVKQLGKKRSKSKGRRLICVLGPKLYNMADTTLLTSSSFM